MINERDKARQIVNLLMEYYVLHGFSHINADISIDETNTKIVLEGTVDHDKVDIDQLDDILHHPRIDEYNDYYDVLSTSSDQEDVNSLGFMLDDYSIHLKDDILLVKIYRKH